jgi:hypothetical protein
MLLCVLHQDVEGSGTHLPASPPPSSSNVVALLGTRTETLSRLRSRLVMPDDDGRIIRKGAEQVLVVRFGFSSKIAIAFLQPATATR